MSQEPSAIPLADILRAANELMAAGLTEENALGGALTAIYYFEPFTTYGPIEKCLVATLG